MNKNIKKITKKNKEGNILSIKEYEYDEKGNCIHHKNNKGFEYWKIYDMNTFNSL